MNVVKEVNPAFEDFIFNWDKKFYFIVGGYGSSKSYHAALKIFLKCLEEKRKVLVVREVFETMRDSTFNLFEEIISDMKLDGLVETRTSPMQVLFPNGSQIIFKGMDKPAKLKSINNVSIIWIEECSELKYEGFKELLGRARHPNLSIHFILTTNPVSKSNWTYKHFFIDRENKRKTLDDKKLYKDKVIETKDVYYHHSTADDNKFLPYSYIEQLEELQEYDQDLYRIARLGQFGINGKKVLPQFEIASHEIVKDKIAKIPKRFHRIGMDFGFITSYNALIKIAIDDKNKYLYIYQEYYDKGKTDDITVEEIRPLIDKKDLIIADNAEPKTIAFYNQSGIRMVGAKKGPGSVLAGIKKVKRFKKIICSEECRNVIAELKELTYATNRNGDIIEDEFNIDAHTFDSIKYALDGYEVADIKQRKNYSGRGARY